MLRLILM
jgi:cell division cycle 14